MLSETNPQWHHFAREMERTNTQPRTNPDGDVCDSFNSFTSFLDSYRVSTRIRTCADCDRAPGDFLSGFHRPHLPHLPVRRASQFYRKSPQNWTWISFLTVSVIRPAQTRGCLLRGINKTGGQAAIVSVKSDTHAPTCSLTGWFVSARSYQDIESCDQLFVVGTTVATYSAFRWASPHPI